MNKLIKSLFVALAVTTSVNALADSSKAAYCAGAATRTSEALKAADWPEMTSFYMTKAQLNMKAAGGYDRVTSTPRLKQSFLNGYSDVDTWYGQGSHGTDKIFNLNMKTCAI